MFSSFFLRAGVVVVVVIQQIIFKDKSSKPPVHPFLAIEVTKNYLMGNS